MLTNHFYIALSVCAVVFWLATPRHSRIRDVAQILMNVTLIFSYIISRPMFWEDQRLIGTDFPAFYSGGTLLHQKPLQLYNVQRQAETQRAASGQDLSNPKDFLPFAYIPIVALVFAPFTFLSYVHAYFAWNVTNLALLGVVLWALLRHFKVEPGNGSLILSVTVLAPIYAGLGNGQTSFLILLLFAGTIIDWRSGKTARAAIWTGMLVIKQTLLPVLLLWFALQRRWKELGIAVATASAMMALSTALVGLDGMRAWLEISQKMARGEFLTTGQIHMESLRAIAVRFGLGDAFWLAMVGLVMAALALAFAIGRITEPARYCIVILASLLVAPHLHMHDVMVTLILLMFVYADGITAWNKWLFLLIILIEAAWVSPIGANGWAFPIVPFTLVGFFGYLVVHSLLAARSARNLLTVAEQIGSRQFPS